MYKKWFRWGSPSIQEKTPPSEAEIFEEKKTLLLKIFAEEQAEEIFFNGFNRCVIQKQRSSLLVTSPGVFNSSEEFYRWLQNLALLNGRRLDPLVPMAGGMMAGVNIRWHAVIPPVCDISCPALSLRRHRFEALSLDDFGLYGNTEQHILLKGLLSSQVPLLIVGPTGAGKTSLLVSLLKFFCIEERVILCESVPEIPLLSSRWLSLVEPSRSYDPQDMVITLDHLVSESLRMRPDRLVVGEIRGHEARSFIQSTLTGHRGSLASIHGSSPEEALKRLRILGGGKLFKLLSQIAVVQVEGWKVKEVKIC